MSHYLTCKLKKSHQRHVDVCVKIKCSRLSRDKAGEPYCTYETWAERLKNERREKGGKITSDK